jgi:truncated hemoglobin YjbI
MSPIERVVRSFYEKAKSDILIGYHFRHIHDFDTHIPRIIHFWEIQLLGASLTMEPFDLIGAHKALGIKVGEVNRWVKLFLETMDEEKIDPDLKTQWSEKTLLFRDRFLSHPQLFSKTP